MKAVEKWVIALVIVLFCGTLAFLYANRAKVMEGYALQPMEMTGSLEAVEADVNVKIPGRVAQIDIEEGQEVTTGQIIAVMEADNIAAKAELAGAALEAATAQYNKAKNGARPQQVEQAREMVAQAKSAYNLAQSTYNRLEQLYNEGVLAQQKLDMAKTELEVAQTRYDSANEQYDMVKEGAQKEDLQAAAALVKQARAAYDEVMTYVTDSTVKAPMAGTITMKAVENGEMVSSGMPLVTITNLADVWVEVKVRESAISRFKLGEMVPVRVTGVPGRVYQGKITYIASKPSFATERAYQEKGEKDMVAFAVKVKLDNTDLKLRPGMTATITLGG